MKHHSESRLLPFSSKELYDIIIDVESYPEFLPWCKDSKVLNKTNSNSFEAKLTVGYKSINETYISNIKFESNKIIETTAIEGPFRHMNNIWKFNSKPNKACLLEFNISFEFKSFLLDSFMGAVFYKATTKLVSAFEERAKNLHGV